MDADSFSMAMQALAIVGDPVRIGYLIGGVLIGLVLGIIPGLGGVIGLSILLPFTFSMDPYAALAMMMGLSAVTNTSDAIPAIMFSVPGTIGSAATVLDGFPMAQRGEAGRALGAAYTASVLGGLFGALVLGISVPLLRPLVLLIGSPELLAIVVLGLSLVAGLSGGMPLKGMAAVCLGIVFAMIGEDPQTATLRWTLDTTYLYDGLPLVPFVLGLFALPEIADLAIARRRISGDASAGSYWAQLQGARDVLRNWWLLIRCSGLGALLGAVPGIGAAVIDWIAYGHAARSEKGAADTFGKGDVRGVIASESSNNAKEGGALIPTIAFGVPGSASMALLLGAFLVHDIVPGPDMLTKHLDVTYTLAWSVAIANIFGAGICFIFANQLAKIALVRIGVLAPLIVSIVFIGVYQSSASWGDLFALMIFGVLGWVMKRADWPRPPIILGFVLGDLFERYLFISYERYAFQWLTFPIVAILLVLAAYSLIWPIVQDLNRERKRLGNRARFVWTSPNIRWSGKLAATLAVVLFFAFVIVSSWPWPFDGKLVTQTVAWGGLLLAALQFLGGFVTLAPANATASPAGSAAAAPGAMADDLVAEFGTPTVVSRALNFFAWCLLLLALTAIIGLLPAILVFVIAYMRLQGRERWGVALPVAFSACAFAYVLFHQIIPISWPQALVGDWFPMLRQIGALNFL